MSTTGTQLEDEEEENPWEGTVSVTEKETPKPLSLTTLPEEAHPTETPEEQEEVEEVEPPPPRPVSEVLKTINLDALKNTDTPLATGQPTPSPVEPQGKKRKLEELSYSPDEIEDKLKRRGLLFTLSDIREKFPEAYKEVIGKKKVYKLPDEALECLIMELKFVIGCSTTNIINEWAQRTVNTGIETILCTCGCECEGFAELCRKDPEFIMIWNELSLNYIHLSFTDPRYKLGLYWLKMAYVTHKQNCAFKAMKQKLDTPGIMRPQPTQPEPKKPKISEPEKEEETPDEDYKSSDENIEEEDLDSGEDEDEEEKYLSDEEDKYSVMAEEKIS